MKRTAARETLTAVLRTAAAVLLALALVAGVVVGAWITTNRPPAHEEQVYLREVHTFIDVSASMDPKGRKPTSANLDKAKQMAAQLVASCGPGDWVSVYTIGTGFSEERNVILNEGVVPVPISFRRLVARRKALQNRDALAALSRTGEGTTEDRQWLSVIGDLQQEPPDGESNYLAAFDYLARRLSSAKQKMRQIEVVAFGDLEQLPMPASGTPPLPDAAHADTFAGAHIRLSYPYRVERSDRMSRVDLERFWRLYFEQRGAGEVTIAPFGDGAEIAQPLEY